MFLLQPAQPPELSQARPKLAVGNGDVLSHLVSLVRRVPVASDGSFLESLGRRVTSCARSYRFTIGPVKGRDAWRWQLSPLLR